ncbi:replication initiator protein A [Staphylococcus equorum]|uniref:Replication initiator protein A n=1 Tax=Staphylococcus equorum TaxID=246432 RepID=A0A9X4LCP5_9STAP|nr:replication initiator protein A [Staphylococcus equorum]MDG0860349.1 replication initiator protein A [Staphylococcus equorum]
MANSFFTENDMDNLIFFQVPKVLILGDRYKSLKPNALKLYIVLLDRMKLSLKNGWKNDEGQYYVRMAQELAIELFQWSKTTFVSMKRELEKHDLLVQEREGQGKSNRLYIKKCEYTEDDVIKINKSVDENLEEEEQKAEIINQEKEDRKQEFLEQKEKVNNGQTNEVKNVTNDQNVDMTLKDRSWPSVDMTEKDTSWLSSKPEVGLLEGHKLATSNNNYIKNYNNKNNKNEKPVNIVNNAYEENFDKMIKKFEITYKNKGMHPQLVDRVLNEAIDGIIKNNIYDEYAYIDACLDKAFYRSLVNAGKIERKPLW